MMMGSENRKNNRMKCYAKVLYRPSKTPGYIRDLSLTGCQISFVQPIPAGKDDEIDLDVVGGGEENTPFSFRLRVRWVSKDGIYYSLGGEIADPESAAGHAAFNKLVEYYQQGNA
jgi:hypothetical protein